jgi:hypothetical protein
MKRDKIQIRREGVTVTIHQDQDACPTWPEVLATAIDAVRTEFTYLDIETIIRHLNTEWGFLLKETKPETTKKKEGKA